MNKHYLQAVSSSTLLARIFKKSIETNEELLLLILFPHSGLSHFTLLIPDFGTQADMHRAARSIGPSYPVPQPHHYSHQVQI